MLRQTDAAASLYLEVTDRAFVIGQIWQIIQCSDESIWPRNLFPIIFPHNCTTSNIFATLASGEYDAIEMISHINNSGLLLKSIVEE